MLIALQARANGELSHRIDNAPQAALVSFSSGLLFVGIYALFSPQIKSGIRRLRAAVKEGRIPVWRLFAGALGGSFVAIQTTVVPLIGVAVYSGIYRRTNRDLFIGRSSWFYWWRTKVNFS